MSAGTIRAGAPPASNDDAQGWRALSVLKMAGEHVFFGNHTTAFHPWAAYAARRCLRRKLAGSPWPAGVIA